MAASATLLIGVFAIAVLDILSLSLGLLTLSGALAATGIGLVVFFFGGWRWFTVLLVFLVVSSFFTKFKYSQKIAMGTAQEKKGARSWANVVANGFASASFALGIPLLPLETVLSGFIGAVSAAFADTLSTEIGILNASPPRLVTDLKKKVPAGTSGGVSLLGELSVLVSTAILTLTISIIGLAPFSPARVFVVTLVSGYTGTTIDSVLGAIWQARYNCKVCGKIVESREHCSTPAQHVKGLGVLDNNGVNFMATWVGAFSAVLLQRLVY